MFRLLPILSNPTELPDSPEGVYFLSAALNDRLVNVWYVIYLSILYNLCDEDDDQYDKIIMIVII